MKTETKKKAIYFENSEFEQILGSNYCLQKSCSFTLWAPRHEKFFLHIISPNNKILEMERGDFGYFSLKVENIEPGTRYFYKLKDGEYPDPASHYQPEGVHGPSQIIDHWNYKWKDRDWRPPDLKDWIIYELHVGTFTPEGTFEAIIPRLNDLLSLGINAIEIMPVSQFPGSRNWGYDGVYIYSVQNSYGTPDQFKKLIDACHSAGIAVILDLVYNHQGPEGNYLGKYGYYFTDKYKVIWGDAINFDGEYCDGVRNYYAGNMLFWIKEYHIDATRMDAIHMVFDDSAIHFWEYATERVNSFLEKSGRKFFLIGECDFNSPKPLLPAHTSGWNFNALWLDDFHHALYTLTDKQGIKYYADYGKIEQMAKAIMEGFVFSGEYVEFRKKKYGRSSAGIPGDKFIVFSQNHDIVGNRMLGERNSVLMSLDTLKLTAAVVLLSPYIPMIFMGEEYAEDNPFLYFVSHSDNDLIEKVKTGRKKSFEKFQFEGEPPDPQEESTFQSSKINWDKRNNPENAHILSWFKHLISLRKSLKVFENFDKNCIRTETIENKILKVERWADDEDIVFFFNFSDSEMKIKIPENSHIILKSSDFQPEVHIHKNGMEELLLPWEVKLFQKNKSL